jgi:Protein of unknown function (DUF3276)
VDNEKKGSYKQQIESVYSKRIRAGKRRTYFFDVRATRSNDYFLTITESKKRGDEGYERFKIFLYKEDFNKFLEALNETIDHIKQELMPSYDFDEAARRQAEYENNRSFHDQEPAHNHEPMVSDSNENSNSVQEPNAPASSASEEDLKW